MFKISFILMCLVISNNVSAACNPLRPSTCVPNKIKNKVKNEFTKSRISVRNKCYEPINVGIQYYNGKKWVRNGWWSIRPRETAYIADSMATNVYFAAHSKNGSRTWGSNSNSFNVRGVSQPAFKANVGTRGYAFTQDFSCS